MKRFNEDGDEIVTVSFDIPAHLIKFKNLRVVDDEDELGNDCSEVEYDGFRIVENDINYTAHDSGEIEELAKRRAGL